MVGAVGLPVTWEVREGFLEKMVSRCVLKGEEEFIRGHALSRPTEVRRNFMWLGMAGESGKR